MYLGSCVSKPVKLQVFHQTNITRVPFSVHFVFPTTKARAGTPSSLTLLVDIIYIYQLRGMHSTSYCPATRFNQLCAVCMKTEG